MKIGYIASSDIPSRSANSVHVMKMCQALSKNGHEVVLIVPNREQEVDVDLQDIFAEYGVTRCFEIVKCPLFPILGGQLIYGFMAALKAKRLCVDLIYSRNNPAAIFSTMLQIATVFELHSPFAKKLKVVDLIFVRLVKSLKLLRIIVISQSLRNYFVRKYPGCVKKIQVVPDGADPFPENVKAVTLSNRVGRMQVGYVGHLYPGKGMEIISKVAQSCLWADFHVVGGTDEDIKYWKRICRSCSNITFHGYVAHQLTTAYIASFDVALLPNQAKVEVRGPYGSGDIGKWTSPLKAFEYMAAARPIICSDLPVLREIFEHDGNALLCSPNDIAAWRSALERLRDDLGLQSRLGRSAQQYFFKNFTWSIRAKRVIEDCQI